jgi:hypothetical protein
LQKSKEKRRKLVGRRVRGIRKGQVIEDLIGPGKEFRFYCKCMNLSCRMHDVIHIFKKICS